MLRLQPAHLLFTLLALSACASDAKQTETSDTGSGSADTTGDTTMPAAFGRVLLHILSTIISTAYIRPYDRYIRPESKILVFCRFWVVLGRCWAGVGPVWVRCWSVLADVGPVLART